MHTTQTEDAPHTFLTAASRAESQIIIQTNLQCVWLIPAIYPRRKA